ncbi:MAG: hypothetical protein H6645_11055 [Caldilineaceae bacterium]|nr:hypothetical protein [Caldilineaceae bacterium]
MNTHAYHRKRRQRIGNAITALLMFVLVASNVLLPQVVYGNTAKIGEVVLAPGAPLAQDEPVDLPVATESLVSKWSGEENADDLIGINDGDMRNGATFTTGKVGQGFHFDGIDDYISAGGDGIDGLQGLTVAAWVQMDSVPPETIARFVTLGGPKAVLRYDGINGPRQLHFYMNINDELYHIRVNDLIEAGSFHHVAGTYDGRTMRLYWDGTQVGSFDVEGTVARGDGIDLSSDGEALNGILDEVAIYNRALSATEIAAIFANNSSPGDSESPASSGQNIQFLENYYVYMYPELPSSEYDAKIAALAPYKDQNGELTERPYTPWLSLKYLAQAREYYLSGDLQLALAYNNRASDEMDAEWAYWKEHPDGLTTHYCGSREYLVRNAFEFRTYDRDADPDYSTLEEGQFLTLDQHRLNWWAAAMDGVPPESPIYRFYCANNAANFAYYYYRMFSVPLTNSDIFRDMGNYEKALENILKIYSEDAFFEPSMHQELESYYRNLLGNIEINPALDNVPQERNQYGHCVVGLHGECNAFDILPPSVPDLEVTCIPSSSLSNELEIVCSPLKSVADLSATQPGGVKAKVFEPGSISMAITDTFTVPSYLASDLAVQLWPQLALEDAVESNPFNPVHPIEKSLIRRKVAQIYMEWGNSLFRQADIDGAKSKYMQVLRIYYIEWLNTIGTSGMHGDMYNPEILKLITSVHLQLSKIGLGMNYLGYREDHVPVWDYSYLRDNARYFIGNAKALERDALSFLDSAEKATEQDMLIEQSIGMAQKTISLEQAKSEQATKAIEIAEKNETLAIERVVNMDRQITDYENLYPNATARGLADNGIKASDQGYKEEFELFGNALGSIPYFGSAASALGGAPMRKAERAFQYANMLREKAELEIAQEVASLEIKRAKQELEIANIGVDIAMFDLQNKQEHRFFAQNKTLSAQFWSELSRDVREKAHQYLDYGIQLAWLAEQAYEFEYQTTVDIIKLDYLSTENWLAADQLLLDLDTIEFKRLTLKKQKDIPITYILSLHDKNLVAIEELKRTGKLTFNTTQQEFDLAYPGTYNRRIKNVEVAVVALVGTEGIRGTLTKAAHSLVKVNTSEIPADTQGVYSDWIQYTPSPYRLRLSRSPEETMILSANGATQSRLTYTDNEQGQKRIFEDHSVTGMWTLELPKYANKFDYETIYDVILKIDLVANYDAGLKDVIEQEMRTLIERGEFPMGEMMGFSLAHHYPDQFYQFHNPVYDNDAAKRYRLIAVPIEPQDLPPNQTNRSLTEFWLGFYDQSGPIPVKAKVTSLGLNPGLDFVLQGGKLMAGGQEIDLDNLRWYPNQESGETFESINTREGTDAVIFRTDALGELGGRPDDYWIIRIDAKDNPALSNLETLETFPEFDEQKIDAIENIIIQLAYQYEIPQYHEILFEPPDSSCAAVPSGIAEIQTQWRTNEVTLDGKITNTDEWADANCFDLPMFKEKTGPVSIHTRWWFKNDADWLYLLARVPRAEIEALGVYIGNFWPEYNGAWDYSDVGWLNKDSNTYDGYGWDESQFYGDTEASPPGANNVEGAANESPSYYWFEFRKALNSGDGRDWSWSPGEIVGTGQTGDLLLGMKDITNSTIYEILILLQLDTQ